MALKRVAEAGRDRPLGPAARAGPLFQRAQQSIQPVVAVV